MDSATSATFLRILTSSTAIVFADKHDDYNADSNDDTSNAANGTTPNATAGSEPSVPMYLSVYVSALSMIVFMTGIVGNVLVVVVVATVKDMRTPMNWYLVNLSVADLLVLLVCQPAALTEFFARDRWYLGEMLCKLVPALEHAALHSSTLTILTITVERYYAICRPLKKLAMCHRPRPWRVLPVVWSVAVVTAVPFIIMTVLRETEFYDGSRVHVCGTRVQDPWHFWYIGFIYVVFFGIPMVVLFFLYAKIIHKLRSSGTALRSRIREDAAALSTHCSRKQVIKMLVGIVLLFFISLSPLRAFILWMLFMPGQARVIGPEAFYNLLWFCRLLMYVNSAGNPIIYSLVSSKFQTAFWRLMRGSSRKPWPKCASSGRSFDSRRSSAVRFPSNGLHRDSATASLRLSSCDSPPVKMCQASSRQAKTPSYPPHKKATVIAWLPLKAKSHSCSEFAHLNRLSACGDAI